MSRDEVTVHVGRNGTDTIAADTRTLETTESFGIVLESHDTPAHVHCRLGGDLAHVATLEQSHYYVEPDEGTYVPILVDDVDADVAGTLEVSTGYGAASVSIDVTVTPGPPPVEVDETLAQPRPSEPEPTVLERLSTASGLDAGTIGLVVLGLVALGVATATAAVVGGPVALVGVLVVVVGIGVATLLLLR